MGRSIPGYDEVKTVLVIGLGKTGHSFLRYLSRYDVQVYITDTRLSKEDIADRLDASVQAFVWDENETPLSEIDLVAASPGVPMHDSLIQRIDSLGISVCSDVAFFSQAIQSPMIAITGTNGKTTVTTLVTRLLKEAGLSAIACGNIGLPVLELLEEDALESAPDFYVCELSSAQLARSPELNAKVAVCLNITDNHLDWHGSAAHYAQSKKHIYDGCSLAVVPKGEVVDASATLSFSSKTDADVCVRDGYYCIQGEPLLPVESTSLRAAHEQANVCAALACVVGCGVDVKQVVSALQSFTALPHRCQKLGMHQGVLWINDSKATSVVAACAGMAVAGEGLSGKVILIMGGLSKGADLHPLVDPISRLAKHVLLMGKDAHRFEEVLLAVVDLTRVSSMEEAVSLAAQLAKRGDAVLLATACDSRDMFTNYEERGEIFCDLVAKLH